MNLYVEAILLTLLASIAITIATDGSYYGLMLNIVLGWFTGDYISNIREYQQGQK